jgi:hypothetical protein
MPAPFLSVLTDDCIAAGKDYNAGGARYNHTFIQFVGIGTSPILAAMRQAGLRGRTLSLAELLAAGRLTSPTMSRSANVCSTGCPSTATTIPRPTT